MTERLLILKTTAPTQELAEEHAVGAGYASARCTGYTATSWVVEVEHAAGKKAAGKKKAGKKKAGKRGRRHGGY